MERMLSFPGLGLEFNIEREALSFGPLTVYWYGLIVVLGIALGVFYALRRSREFGLHPDRMTDVLLYSVLVGMLGARIYYVAFSWEYYRNNLGEIVQIWKGGIAIYGGIIAAFLMGCFLCRRWKMPVLPTADCAVGGLILGQAIGRWGNFVNIEAFGSNTALPWGMSSPVITSYLAQHQEALAAVGVVVNPNLPVHPTFLYESLWNLVGFVFLAWYVSRRRFNGELTLLYCGWYGLARFWIEGLRTDSLMLGSIRISQMVAVLAVLASVVLWLICNDRIRKSTAPEWLVGQSAAALAAQAEAMAPQPKESPGEQEEISRDEATPQAQENDAGQDAPTEPDAPPQREEGADGPTH